VAFLVHEFPEHKHFIPGKWVFENDQFLPGVFYQNDGCARQFGAASRGTPAKEPS
jgi:hypothetical protein